MEGVGLRYLWCAVAGAGPQAECCEGCEDQAGGGLGGSPGVEAVELGGGGEVAAGFAFDEAVDEQGEADDADECGDAPVGGTVPG